MRLHMLRFVLLPVLFLLALPSRAENMDPAGKKIFAWSENAGWLNAQPQGPGGSGMQVNDFNVTGWLWSENTGWVNLSCRNTGTCGAVNFGVVNNGAGVLSGYAWSENAGWIDFGAPGAGVTIGVATGTFAGYAWSENLGWISFYQATGPGEFKLTTQWICSPAPALPSGSPLLIVTKAGAVTTLAWSGVAGGSAYDVVRGDLLILLAGGDFRHATQSCLANNTIDLTTTFNKNPSPGNGYWFLVRGVNCGGAGTYDDGSASQIGSRDQYIEASGNACP